MDDIILSLVILLILLLLIGLLVLLVRRLVTNFNGSSVKLLRDNASELQQPVSLEARLHLVSAEQFNPQTLPSLLKQKFGFKSICVSLPAELCSGQLVTTILKSAVYNNSNNKVGTKVTVVEHNDHCLYPVATPEVSHVVVLDWQQYNRNMTTSLINHITTRDNSLYLYAPILYQQQSNSVYRLAGEGVVDSLAIPHVIGGYCLSGQLLCDTQLQHKLSSQYRLSSHCELGSREYILADYLYSKGVTAYCVDDVVYQYGRVYLDFASHIPTVTTVV